MHSLLKPKEFFVAARVATCASVLPDFPICMAHTPPSKARDTVTLNDIMRKSVQ